MDSDIYRAQPTEMLLDGDILVILGSFSGELLSSAGTLPTEGPSWGYPRGGLGALGAVLEPFCGYLSPKVDKIFEK